MHVIYLNIPKLKSLSEGMISDTNLRNFLIVSSVYNREKLSAIKIQQRGLVSGLMAQSITVSLLLFRIFSKRKYS